jgi:hypothetical protein
MENIITNKNMDNKLLFIPCAIESISTRKDKTLKITIGTQELDPKSMSQLLNQWSNGYGIMAFKKEEFNIEEKELLESIKINQEELNTKTPSQRLRAVLYILYTKNNEGYNDFTNYYLSKIEKLIKTITNKIDQYDNNF